MARTRKKAQPLVCPFTDVGMGDITLVGGKNASLGELNRELKGSGLGVPPGFIVTAAAFDLFIAFADLKEPIAKLLQGVDGQNLRRLADRGRKLRTLIGEAPLPPDVRDQIEQAYDALQDTGTAKPDVAVRSSATAEDLPGASFAGQHDSFLNVRGKRAVVHAVQQCFASMFTDRAIAYRIEKGFEHAKVRMSVGVQTMVRSDKGASGVMFSVEPETAFPDMIVINAAWGLGEGIVQGIVDPDEYWVFQPLLAHEKKRPLLYKKLGSKEQAVVYDRKAATKFVRVAKTRQETFVLDETDILKLARGADQIATHYKQPMDIEWAKDGMTGQLYIVQARPETGHELRKEAGLKTYHVHGLGQPLVIGLGVGEGITTGKVCKLSSPHDIAKFKPGSILVAPATDPDWAPIMQRAAAIVTDHGGRTSHAAIVCRELGLPGIVGTHSGFSTLKSGAPVTVSSNDGTVYEGTAQVDVKPVNLKTIPSTKTNVMLNIANPGTAAKWWQLPCDGVGLARMEFIINTAIKAHPLATVHPDKVHDKEDRRLIAETMRGWSDPKEFFIDTLAYGIARIAAPVYPKPVIVRMSDFKTNEYASLAGGKAFEPEEENPMLGWRGASRYYSPDYKEGFELECRALKKVRSEMGMSNVVIMIPFCRTLDEADKVLSILARNGHKRGKDGLEVYVMCEIPANVILAKQFADRFDGFSIGSNDLTQLTLGVDRDSDVLASLFREDDPAVTGMIEMVIKEAHAAGTKVGLCGQAPSNDPSFAEFLVSAGIDSISVTPDSFAKVKRHVAKAEAKQGKAKKR